jgi:hypothetical protein
MLMGLVFAVGTLLLRFIQPERLMRVDRCRTSPLSHAAVAGHAAPASFWAGETLPGRPGGFDWLPRAR